MRLLNPKAVAASNLYGYMDPNTNEWHDGLVATLLRSISSSSSIQNPKWLVFDGPVDAYWVESMNTTLDDNKKLCLISGEIIHIPQNINMFFECQDLNYASPATVSRCGIVLMDDAVIEWNALVLSWTNINFPDSDSRTLFSSIVDQYLPRLIILEDISESTRGSFSMKGLVASCLVMVKAQLDKTLSRSFAHITSIFLFACIWTFGSLTDDWRKFNDRLRAVAEEMSTVKLVAIPSTGLVFDYFFDVL